MNHEPRWHDLGPAADFERQPLQQLTIGKLKLALSFQDGVFGAVSGVCNHAGGPLGDGRLEGDYIVCPWHYWKFHRATGEGEPGFEEDRVPRHAVKIEDGRLWVDLEPATRRTKKPHAPHPLQRPIARSAGGPRVLGISTTAMTVGHERFSTSEALLETSLAHAAANGAETRMVRLGALSFRSCEGFYSKSSHACTWPCSITQMDPADQMDQVYEGVVHWADVILVATPIRWGSASALYYKMVERMNCVQNQVTIANRVLLRDKVAAFIITGGQDNVQAVAGQMLGFFAEVGCVFPQFPYIAHSRGWSAEDMERNIQTVQMSTELHDGARALASRCLEMAERLLASGAGAESIARGGRKAHRPDHEAH